MKNISWTRFSDALPNSEIEIIALVPDTDTNEDGKNFGWGHTYVGKMFGTGFGKVFCDRKCNQQSDYWHVRAKNDGVWIYASDLYQSAINGGHKFAENLLMFEGDGHTIEQENDAL